MGNKLTCDNSNAKCPFCVHNEDKIQYLVNESKQLKTVIGMKDDKILSLENKQCDECIQQNNNLKLLMDEIEQCKLMMELKNNKILLLENEINILEKYKMDL
jgi:hypothetical protein